MFDPEAFQRVVSRGAGGKSVPLNAERVDYLPFCGAADPLPLVPDPVRAVVTNPDALLVPNSLSPSVVCATFSGNRSEYVKLVRRQCRSRKVVRSRDCKFSASCFAVGKSEVGRQREVWDGSSFSNASVSPPAPPLSAALRT